jgi:hypothetical protein
VDAISILEKTRRISAVLVLRLVGKGDGVVDRASHAADLSIVALEFRTASRLFDQTVPSRYKAPDGGAHQVRISTSPAPIHAPRICSLASRSDTLDLEVTEFLGRDWSEFETFLPAYYAYARPWASPASFFPGSG